MSELEDPSFASVKPEDPDKSFSDPLLKCGICGETKPVSQFHKRPIRYYGYDYCKKCAAKMTQKYYWKNPDKVKNRLANYYINNWEEVIARKTEYNRRYKQQKRDGTFVKTRERPEGSGRKKVPRYYEIEGETFILMTALKFEEDET